MSEYLTIEVQIKELLAAGWRQDSHFRDLWHSPDGRLFLERYIGWNRVRKASEDIQIAIGANMRHADGWED